MFRPGFESITTFYLGSAVLFESAHVLALVSDISSIDMGHQCHQPDLIHSHRDFVFPLMAIRSRTDYEER